jgi:hypothetical protein
VPDARNVNGMPPASVNVIICAVGVQGNTCN